MRVRARLTCSTVPTRSPFRSTAELLASGYDEAGGGGKSEARNGGDSVTLPYTEHMSSREYEVVLIPEDEGRYSVTVPALPGCVSQGATREEALAMIREAIELYLESLEAHGDPIPGPVEIERVTVSA
jgi:antitoxin HicB